MKKVLALLLVLAMLVPMGLTVPAKAEEVKKKPFYALSWGGFDKTKYPHLNGMAWSSFSNSGENAKISFGGATVTYGSYTDEHVTAFATKVKETMEARPEGMRYWYAHGPGVLLGLAPENAIFMDFFVDQMAEMMHAILKKMKEINCPLDGVVVDTEYHWLSVYYLIDTDAERQPDNLVANPKLLQKLVKDPRYKTRIRPLLEEYGFVFYEAANPTQQAAYTELWSLTKNAGAKYAKSRDVWNIVMRIHLNMYCNQWCYEPVKANYPDAHVSDYQSTDGKSWMKVNAVTDGGDELTGGNTIKVGNTSTYNYYYTNPSAAHYEKLIKVSGYNDSYFVEEPFTNLLYDINFTRYMAASTEDNRIAPWITGYTYDADDKWINSLEGRMCYTPYYADLLYHLGMFNPQPFLSYTTKGEYDGKEGEYTAAEEWELVAQVMNDILKALTDVAGYADRKPIELPMNWNSKFVLTGMYCNGRNLWRITPNTRIIARGDFLISNAERNEDPTFFVNGETVTFPGGKILPEAEIANCGSYGYWVETAKDVMPIVTADEDRYEVYPSLKYDFEDYNYGAFNYDTSKPTNAWGFTWGKTSAGLKGESNIITMDDNKMLSIIGNTKSWVKSLPGNITAGDTYAKDQAWSITVTIPEGLSKDATINLLNYTGEKQEIADGGFMIKDGKLYYSTGAEDEEEPIYAELMDVKMGGTYTFKRLMDFNDKDAFTSTFVVCNKNGRELKRVEDVPAPVFVTIDTVGFAVVEADKAVYVDDFMMYLTGTALDFSVYDAEIGYNAEVGVVRDRSTGYRLSWLNATTEEETVAIKADITEGGKTTTTVIKEIKMKPGHDGIETGVVEIKEGQTAKVYIDSTLAPIANAEEAGPLVDATFTEGAPEKVPSALQKIGMDSIDKIKEALEGKLKESSTDGMDAITYYQYKVNKNDIPRNGKMTVIMPYPAGTNANYTFYGAQLHRADAYGKKAGDVEAIKVINTSEGIQFEIFGTSPIAIGWTAPVEVEITEATVPTRTPNELDRPVGTRITRPTEAPEIEETEEPTEETEYIEDTEPTEEPTEAPTETAPVAVEDEGGVNIVLIIVIAVVVLAGAGAAVFFLLKKKKVAAPAAEEIEDIEEPEASEENTEE